MSVRIGIMGFGRIGRNIFRLLHGRRDLQIVAIADIAEPTGLGYLLRYDTVHGRFPEPVRVVDDSLYADGRQIKMITAREPGEVNWAAHGVDMVVESTNKYRKREMLSRHLEAGARNVILASPPHRSADVDALVVSGVNDELVSPEHRILSNGSCTINALAPVLQLLSENFGIEHAYFTSVHAYTNDQRLADVPHREIRRSRAAAENIIPTETYTHHHLARILPELEGKVTGRSLAVPVPDGSNVDLTAMLSREVTAAEVNEVVRSAANSRYESIFDYSEDPLVSSDVIGGIHSGVFDGLATSVMAPSLVKTVTWYDNGWGYAHRIVELMEKLAVMQGETVGS